MNQPAQQASAPDRVSCLIAPLTDRKLLLPITAVAEVVNTFSAPEAAGDQGSLYGWLNWRDQRIPLVSFEAAAGGKKQPVQSGSRMAVLNAIGDAGGLGYYGILLQGLPNPVQVNGESLRETTKGDQQMILSEAQLGEEALAIPDLLALETLVAGFPKD